MGIFRARRAALGAGRARGLTVNFRSRPEILDVVNAAFGAAARRRASRRWWPAAAPEELRLFAPDPPEEPRVELLVCETAGWEEREAELGLAALAAQPWRRAEARAVAARLRAEVATPAGRCATSSCSCARRARCGSTSRRSRSRACRTYVVGGRGYWSQEQVRDGIAYLGAAGEPARRGRALRDARLAVLRRRHRRAGAARRGRPRARATAPGRRCAAPARPAPAPAGSPTCRRDDGRRGCGAFARFVAGERLRAERLPVEVLLERAIAATGYDLAILARAGGDRRLANLRKLMRLAREYERAEGRDLRGFLAYAVGQDLAEAREGEAALESEGLDAVRLMTIHRAKGLEFPVVCVADLGRPGAPGRERLLIGADGGAGLKLATLAGGDPVPALGYDRIADELAAGRGGRGAPAALRRRDARRGAADPLGRRRHREVAGAAPRRPAAGLARARRCSAIPPPRSGDASAAVVALRRRARSPCGSSPRGNLPAARPPRRSPREPRAPAPGTALPAEPKVIPSPGRPQPAQRRLSYSSLQDYARCPYRFYLDARARPAARSRAAARRGAAEAPAAEPRRSRAALRGTLVHELLERLDFAPPGAARRRAGAARSRRRTGSSSTPRRSRTCARRSRRSPPRRCARGWPPPRGVRREAGFAFALEPGGGGPLVRGFVDVLAREPDGTVLVVDYKTDRLGEETRPRSSSAPTRPSAWSTRSPRCTTGRRASRSPTACSSARPSRSPPTFTTADAPALADALLGLAAGVLAEAGRSPSARTASCAATAPGRPRCAPGPRR